MTCKKDGCAGKVLVARYAEGVIGCTVCGSTWHSMTVALAVNGAVSDARELAEARIVAGEWPPDAVEVRM